MRTITVAVFAYIVWQVLEAIDDFNIHESLQICCDFCALIRVVFVGCVKCQGLPIGPINFRQCHGDSVRMTFVVELEHIFAFVAIEIAPFDQVKLKCDKIRTILRLKEIFTLLTFASVQ